MAVIPRINISQRTNLPSFRWIFFLFSLININILSRRHHIIHCLHWKEKIKINEKSEITYKLNSYSYFWVKNINYLQTNAVAVDYFHLIIRRFKVIYVYQNNNMSVPSLVMALSLLIKTREHSIPCG